MAETTQKPKTRKSRVPKTQPTPEEVIFSEVPEVKENPKAEIKELPEIEENLEEEIPAEILENIEAEVSENSKEDLTEIPENSTEISTESLGDIAAAGAHLYKLRPDLPDDRSKWAVQIQTGPRSYHRIFEGSLVRARNRAFRWNLKHNLPNIKINQISK